MQAGTKETGPRRFPFPESDVDRARREARQTRRAELDAIGFDSLSSDEEPADDEIADHNGFTPSERREREREELIQRVRDEESMKWAKGVVIGFVALLVLIAWSRANGDDGQSPLRGADVPVHRKINGLLAIRSVAHGEQRPRAHRPFR
ncbi:hypothetical protein ACF1AY_18715 [Streptomyces sp. NPDC014776]|uniref:hypothetical protein n=1 Tax=Streptomyces sp. NPDC014776 TaxID=3364909 RepID=UPI0036FDD61A